MNKPYTLEYGEFPNSPENEYNYLIKLALKGKNFQNIP
jgi:hypothetical protein